MTRFVTRRTVVGAAAAGAAVALAARPTWGQAKVITARLSHNKNPDEQFHKIIVQVADRILERSGGELHVRLFPAAQLGDELPAAEAVSTGSIQMALVSASGAGTFHGPFGAFIAPYAFKDWQEVRKVVDSKLGSDLSEQLAAKKNMRILEYFNDGTRVIVTRSKPIRSLSDLQGLKIRVPPNKLFLETFRSFGAAATPLAFGDLFPAMQQSVVDGCDFGLALITPARMYEVAKHVSRTNHMVTTLQLLVNASWQKSLSPKLQAILAEEMRAGSERFAKLIEQDEQGAVTELRKRGMNVVEDPDIPAFRKAAEAVPKVMGADWGEGFWEKLQAAKTG